MGYEITDCGAEFARKYPQDRIAAHSLTLCDDAKAKQFIICARSL